MKKQDFYSFMEGTAFLLFRREVGTAGQSEFDFIPRSDGKSRDANAPRATCGLANTF